MLVLKISLLNFLRISKIPRESGHEAKIADFFVNVAKESKLYYFKDENNNVLIKKKGNINSKSIIIKKLMDLFPGYYGKFISLNFSMYLTGTIETNEQIEAFKEIIDFFDNVPNIEIPKDLQEYLDTYLAEYSNEEGQKTINNIIQAKDKNIRNIDEFIRKNKESIDQYNAYRKTEKFKNSSANRLMELMKQVCSTNGYYEKFIPAMRRFSPLYNEYYEEMIKANEQFIRNYPEYTE